MSLKFWRLWEFTFKFAYVNKFSVSNDVIWWPSGIAWPLIWFTNVSLLPIILLTLNVPETSIWLQWDLNPQPPSLWNNTQPLWPVWPNSKWLRVRVLWQPLNFEILHSEKTCIMHLFKLIFHSNHPERYFDLLLKLKSLIVRALVIFMKLLILIFGNYVIAYFDFFWTFVWFQVDFCGNAVLFFISIKGNQNETSCEIVLIEIICPP